MSAPRRLHEADDVPIEEREQQRESAERERHRQRVRDDVAHRSSVDEAVAQVAAKRSRQPPCILDGDGAVEPELGAQPRRRRRARARRQQKGRRIARREPEEHEGERQHAPVQQRRRARARARGRGSARGDIASRRAASTLRRALAARLLARRRASHRSAAPTSLVMASGADLESANPLVTTHPLSRQVQRYALFVTLTRYDSALVAPAVLRARVAVERRTSARSRCRSSPDLHWHDGVPHHGAAMRPSRCSRRRILRRAIRAPPSWPRSTPPSRSNDTTLVLRFARRSRDLPALSRRAAARARASLGACRALARCARRRSTMRRSATDPSASSPPARRTLDASRETSAFPPSLGGPPSLRAASSSRSWTRRRRSSPVSRAVSSTSPASRRRWRRSRGATRRFEVLTYPVLFGTALCFNTTRAAVRRRARASRRRALDRSRAHRRRRARRLRHALVEPDPAGQSARVAPPRRRSTPLVADSLLDAAGWRRGADGRRAARWPAVRRRAAHRRQRRQRRRAARPERSRGARHHGARAPDGDGHLPHHGARRPTRRFDLLIAGIPGDLSFSYVSALFDSRAARRNAGLHRLPRIPHSTTLLARAAIAPEGAAQRTAWRDVQVALDTLAPATWLYHSRGVQGISRRVRGVRMDLRGELVTVHDWSLRTAGSGTVSLLLDAAAARRATRRRRGSARATRRRPARASSRPCIDGRVDVPARKGAAQPHRWPLSASTARCSPSIRSIRAIVCPRVRHGVRGRPARSLPARTGTSSGSPSACCTPRVLGVLLDDAECRSRRDDAARRVRASSTSAIRIADNVLGPSRPFFSTYLESIWLLQLITRARSARVDRRAAGARDARRARPRSV